MMFSIAINAILPPKKTKGILQRKISKKKYRIVNENQSSIVAKLSKMLDFTFSAPK